MKIVLAADHRGFALKEGLALFLKAEGHTVEDVGAHEHTAGDDYTDFAYAGALLVASDPSLRGIFFCGSGMGMDIVANKVKGIRAVIVKSVEEAQYARTHDDVNVITFAADHTDDDEVRAIVKTFLDTPFSTEERHVRRVQKIRDIEAENFKDA